MTQIHIGKSSVPIIDYAVGAAAILGIRDSGKTVTAKGIVEQLLDAKIPVIVFDAVGKWRWMKDAAPGGKSYKIVVAGGRAPDLPLTPESVTEIVRSAVKERIPLVIDFYDRNLSKADWKRIVKTAIRIIHYENEGGPIHIVLEEAAEFVPQKVIDGDVYAEIEKVVRMGGNASVGITLINQRSQEVNKAVLEQCTILVLGQQVGNKAIEAVGKWVERLDKNIAHEVLESLPHLKPGEAWVWTRQNASHPTREQMPMCRSFHPDRRQSSEIKVEGLRSSDPSDFITRLSESIPKVIAQAKANDPKELHKEISRLKHELRAMEGRIQTRDIPVLTAEDLEHWKKITEVASNTIERVGNELIEKLSKFTPNPAWRNPRPNEILSVRRMAPDFQPKVERTKRVTDNGKPLGKAERAILQIAASYGNCSKKKAAVMSGYAMSGGGFNNALGRLRSEGMISQGDPFSITEFGLAAAGGAVDLPKGEALFQMWMGHPQIGKAEREILRVLWEHGRPMSKEEIASNTTSDRGEPYDPTGGGFNNAIGRLRSLELITGKGHLELAEEFRE